MFDKTSKQPKFKMLLGNKSESYAKAIPSEDAAEYASKHDEKMLFFEVSAKNGSNVTESFQKLADLIHQSKLDEKNVFTEIELFDIEEDMSKKPSICCCKLW